MKQLILIAFVIVAISGCNKSTDNKAGNQQTNTDSKTTGAAAVMYYNGDIITMEGNQPVYAEAVVVKDGKILFVGASDEAMKKAGKGHKMIDLQGKTMLPGFLDAHSHYISALTAANQAQVYAPPAGPGKDVESIIAAIEKFRTDKNVPNGELIQSYG